MTILEFYASQSSFTDPGRNSSMFEGLPKSAEEICTIIDGICLDYDERWKYPIQNERWLETNNRYVDEFLDSIRVLNKKLPTVLEARPADERMMTSVSHVATMCVSMLRYVGIPARKRVGFIPAGEGFTLYEIVEYFEDGQVKKLDPARKGEGFVRAAQAFADFRAKKMCPCKLNCAEKKGKAVAVAALMLDLAAVNKNEMLGWDRYGWMLRPIDDFSDRAWEILDGVAAVLLEKDMDVEALKAAYESEEGLMVPKMIYCDTPIIPPHKAVIR